MLLAAVNFESPLFWAVFIGWILSVVLHEFAHGVVAHLGGDWTIKERGGLTLNPLQYVDPFTSLLLPAIFLAMGGVPLPGGATYIRRDLLRSKHWSAAVSLAGPAMNLLLFVAFALPLHPKFGWVDAINKDSWTTAQIFCGAMAVLQILGALFNLVPVPPLDGFQAIAPYMDPDLRDKLSTPPISTFLFFAYFMIVWRTPAVMLAMLRVMQWLLDAMGFGPTWIFFPQAFDLAIWGSQ